MRNDREFPMTRKGGAMRAGGLVLCGLVAAGLVGCVGVPEVVRQGESSARISIIAINAGSQLLSDVISDEGVFNDDVNVEVQAVSKNPLAGTATPATDVLMERYEVRYRRSDGRNVEGVDVPFSISGPLAGRISLGGTTGYSVGVVRHQQKDEPPLRNLRGGGGANVLTVIAEVTVYGRTAMGEGLSATGLLQITFADFGG